jgi:hypothetical protein
VTVYANDPRCSPEERARRLEGNARRQREYNARKMIEYKKDIYDVLGHECSRCGFDDERALTIDHISGGGSQERKNQSGGAIGYYRRLRNEIVDGSTDYRCLCWNCNWIVHLETQPVKILAPRRRMGRPVGSPNRIGRNIA